MKIIFIGLLLCLDGFAEQYDYKKYWTSSGLVRTDAESAFGVEIKTSPVFRNLPIATVSYTKNNKEPKEKVLSVLKKTVPSANWSFETIDGLEIYETYSKQTGTMYRLAYNVNNNEFSLASIAVRFLLPTYLEAHLMQMKQLKTNKNSSNKFTNFMKIFIKSAEAQSFALPPITIDTAQLSGAIRGLGPEISNLNSGLTAIGNSGNNVAGSINNISQTARDLMAPANIARTAGIAGATFGISSALSSMATNFLVNGTMSMLRTLFYEAAGELKPEEKEARLKRFESSMKSFAELSPKLAELGSKMAAASVEITLASGISQEQYLTKIDQEIAKANKAKTEASTDCSECISGVVLKIEQLEDLKKIVRATGNRTNEDLLKSCENMDNLYLEWVNVEYVMLNSRRLILQDLLIFNGQIVENTQQQDVFQEDRKKIESCKARSKKILSDINAQIDVNKCFADTANLSLPICRRYSAHSEILKNCDSLANTQLTENQKIELEEATARLSTSLAQFSKSLASMSCERDVASCSKSQMDLARTEASEGFKAVAEQCPNRAFAVAMKKSTAIKAPVVNTPAPKDTRNFLQRIFDGSTNPNQNVALDPVLAN